jgi:hypothetical protein
VAVVAAAVVTAAAVVVAAAVEIIAADRDVTMAAAAVDTDVAPIAASATSPSDQESQGISPAGFTTPSRRANQTF